MKQLVVIKINLMLNGRKIAEDSEMKILVLLKMLLVLPNNVQGEKILKLGNSITSEHIELDKKKIILQP